MASNERNTGSIIPLISDRERIKSETAAGRAELGDLEQENLEQQKIEARERRENAPSYAEHTANRERLQLEQANRVNKSATIAIDKRYNEEVSELNNKKSNAIASGNTDHAEMYQAQIDKKTDEHSTATERNEQTASSLSDKTSIQTFNDLKGEEAIEYYMNNDELSVDNVTLNALLDKVDGNSELLDSLIGDGATSKALSEYKELKKQEVKPEVKQANKTLDTVIDDPIVEEVIADEAETFIDSFDVSSKSIKEMPSEFDGWMNGTINRLLGKEGDDKLSIADTKRLMWNSAGTALSNVAIGIGGALLAYAGRSGAPMNTSLLSSMLQGEKAGLSTGAEAEAGSEQIAEAEALKVETINTLSKEMQRFAADLGLELTEEQNNLALEQLEKMNDEERRQLEKILPLLFEKAKQNAAAIKLGDVSALMEVTEEAGVGAGVLVWLNNIIGNMKISDEGLKDSVNVSSELFKEGYRRKKTGGN